MCQHQILSQNGQTVISQCPDCKGVNIWQHNLLLSFLPEQFVAFKDFTSQLDFAEASFPFPDGEDRFVLRTPNSDISFAFTEDEWETFKLAMDEAEYMMSIYNMLSAGNQ